jgi:hypothetical protein
MMGLSMDFHTSKDSGEVLKAIDFIAELATWRLFA